MTILGEYIEYTVSTIIDYFQYPSLILNIDY